MEKYYYTAEIKWTGNKGVGTEQYHSYDRDHEISVDQKPSLFGSADPGFLGDKTKYNPEELLLSSLSACHMLWHLHLCAKQKVVVVNYKDHADRELRLFANGSGKFKPVTLNPLVAVTTEWLVPMATKLHEDAHKMCFIANSVNFHILHLPKIEVKNNL